MPITPPQHCPTPRELDDLELLVSGALLPTAAFNEPGSPITLDLPPNVERTALEVGAVELVDPEGLPLAQVAWPSGTVTPLTHAQFGPFRQHYLTPQHCREQYAGRTFVPVTGPLTDSQVDHLTGLGPVVLVALVGAGTPSLSAPAAIRACLAAADRLTTADVVAVPLASHGDAAVDRHLAARVLGHYAGPDPVATLPEGGELSGRVAEIVRHDRPPVNARGLVLFFTGLSGSGKSTLARALMDRLLEQGTRTVTSLDGDVVRRHLSAGLTFSREDRETNIRRIGWVAGEISRHRGVAICSPIAPFDQTRQQVRQMVEEAGGAFVLIHVATPLEECERRDRKGLYAKARRGEIPDFTGISSPYEEPKDADVRVDTTGRTIEEALDDVVQVLHRQGYLQLAGSAASATAAPVASPEAARDDAPIRVLFVCTANICRSPFMELLARQLAGPDEGVVFASAGTHGFREHPMDDVMAGTLPARGVEGPGPFHSRPLSKAILDDADLVLTAEAAHRTFILDDHPAMFRKVFTLGQFAEAVRSHDGPETGRELIDVLGRHRGAADPAVDVQDPYRQGPEAAEKAADGIEDLLRLVVPALTPTNRRTPA